MLKILALGCIFSGLALSILGLAVAQESTGVGLLGGAASTDKADQTAFLDPIPGLSTEEMALFRGGASFFYLYWINTPVSETGGDGLAPLLNARSCSVCHFQNGRGFPPTGDSLINEGLILRLALPQRDQWGRPLADPIYGPQLQDQEDGREGYLAISYEDITGAFPDGEAYQLRRPLYRVEALAYGNLDPGVIFSPRLGPQLIGLGLLEAIPEEAILALADPADRDGDGISGRPAWVWDAAAGDYRLGRFGWRAEQVSLRGQIAAALWQDMGITSPDIPDENCSPAQAALCPKTTLPEMAESDMQELLMFMQALAVPRQRQPDNPQVLAGGELFRAAGCADCHTESYTTGPHPLASLAWQTISPYTDLLLHNMGPGLADQGVGGSAEWRTPPLWGIGLLETVGGRAFYLHDGRARNLTEAILWHGGEGEASRAAFLDMSPAERAALLAFLKSL
jgi:CxxC motif-containing protein (DUF1111 family)